MNNFKQVKEDYQDKYKGLAVYTVCMTEALFTGIASFALTFSVAYFTQVLAKSRLPYQPKYFLIAPAILSSAVSWTVTSRKTRFCQEVWKNPDHIYTECH